MSAVAGSVPPQVSTLAANTPAAEGPQTEEVKISIRGSHFRAPPRIDEEVVMRSLRMQSDPRYQAISHFRGLAARGEGHSARVLQEGQMLNRTVLSGADLSYAEVVAMEQASSASSSQNQTQLQGRREWQECFESSVNRMMADFDLTHNAQARLNHLDRTHAWFEEQGGKQVRKDKKAPSYISVVGRSGMHMPGSTTDISKHISGASLILAGAYNMKRTYRHSDGSQTAR